MSTPTLRRIKRRRLHTALPPSSYLRPTRPPTPVPGFHPQDATAPTAAACDVGTESVCSEEVEASTSFSFDNSETLEDSFPSIPRLIGSLSQAYQENDPAAFWALAPVFATVVHDVASSIVASEPVDLAGDRFILAKTIFRLLLDTFISTTNKVEESHRRRHGHLEMRQAIEYAQMVHESLALLYRSGRKFKSLPPLPLSQVLQVPPGASAAHSIARPVHPSQRRNPTLPALNRRSSLPSLPALAPGVPRLDNFNQRHTTLFFGEGRTPTFSDVKEGCGILKSNKSNRVQAVSVSFLISIITSGEGATSLGLIQAILACFRLFITPAEFFQELKERFELQPPKDASGWDTKISNIRANVLAVIYSWLDQHWQVDSDAVILGRIRVFVESENDSHGKLDTLLAKIKAREGCSEASIFDERRRRIAATNPARAPPPDCTKFIFPQSFNDSSDGLLQLNSNDGREELSRHLTMKMSHLYRQLDPNKIVEFWYKEGESCRNYDKFKDEPGVKELAAISAYGEQLTLWIISSVLEVNNIKRRADRLSLWVDVASRCMAHCDYATAHNIYVSLSFSSIIRLKKSIFAIPYPPKVQYRELEKFFQNEQMFRKTFDDLQRSLPSSTAPLIKDIIYAKKSIEKDKTLIQESAPNPSHTTPEQKFISLDECRVLQQATRVLNKALLEYKFRENQVLSKWVDDRLKGYHSIDTESVYQELHRRSYKQERTQKDLSQFTNPWRYTSSKPSNPVKGKFARLSSGVNQSMATVEEKKKAVQFLKVLAFG